MTLTTETSKAKVTAINLPDGANRCSLQIDEAGHSYILYYIDQQPKQHYLQRNGLSILGFPSELTEQQMESVVDSYSNEVGTLYVDYATNTYQFMKIDKAFASLLKKMGALGNHLILVEYKK